VVGSSRAGMGVGAPLAVSVALYGLLWWLCPGTLDVTFDWGVPRCAAGFLLGVAVNGLRQRAGATLNGVAWHEAGALTAAAAALSLAHRFPWTQHLSVLAFAACIFAFSDARSGLLGRALQGRVAQRAGAWSYSVYMVHALVLAALGNVAIHLLHVRQLRGVGMAWSVAGNAAVLLLVLGVARVTYGLVELPGKAWVARWMAERQPSVRSQAA